MHCAAAALHMAYVQSAVVRPFGPFHACNMPLSVLFAIFMCHRVSISRSDFLFRLRFVRVLLGLLISALFRMTTLSLFVLCTRLSHSGDGSFESVIHQVKKPEEKQQPGQCANMYTAAVGRAAETRLIGVCGLHRLRFVLPCVSCVLGSVSCVSCVLPCVLCPV